MGALGPVDAISGWITTHDRVAGPGGAALPGTLLCAGLRRGAIRGGDSVSRTPAGTRQRGLVPVLAGHAARLCAVSVLSVGSAESCVRRDRPAERLERG